MGVPGEELRLVAERTAEVMLLVFAHHTGWECSWERPVHGQEVSAAGGSLVRRKSHHARNQAGEGGGEERNAEGGAGISVRKGAQLGDRCGRNQEQGTKE